MDFGFTNEDKRYNEAIAYREAAVADGWKIKPTYPNHEALESAATLEKDGFHMSVISRIKSPGRSKWKYEATIHIWGPDGLAILPPRLYDWKAIVEAINICPHCGKNGPTQRYSFAGRSCAECLPELRKTHEHPGWDR